MRAASANIWTGVQVLSVLFVAVLTAAAAQLSFPLPFTPVPFTIQPMIVLVGAAAQGAARRAQPNPLSHAWGGGHAGVCIFARKLPRALRD